MIYVEALNVALAIWLIASSYILGTTLWTSARLTSDIFGGLILGMAITRMAMSQRSLWWLSFGNVILGLWVAISPFTLGYHYETRAMINNIIVGVLVALFAATGFLRSRQEPQQTATARAATPLAAPQLLSPPDGSTIDVYPRVFTVSWLPVPGATSYTVTVQMCLYGITPLVYAGGYLGPCVFPTQFYGFAPTGGGWVSQSTSDGEQTTTSTSVTFGNFVGHQPGRWSVVANGPGTVSPRSAWRIIYF